jgi:hypothetical protein
VLLTGVPRSGTTLSCHLLNKVPDTVALHEAMDVSRFFGETDGAKIRRTVAKWCAKTRESVLERGVAPSKQVGGKVPDNPWSSSVAADGKRERLVTKGEVTIDRPMTPKFTLVVKHPGLFTALIEHLVPEYPLYAVVRNPLSVLCSWSTMDPLMRDGRVPATERLVPGLTAKLEALPDSMSRQLHVVNWYFGRYAKLLDPQNVLRYEDVIASRGKKLGAVVPGASDLDEPLKSKNKNELYGSELMKTIAARLHADDGPWRRFYDDASVDALLG